MKYRSVHPRTGQRLLADKTTRPYYCKTTTSTNNQARVIQSKKMIEPTSVKTAGSGLIYTHTTCADEPTTCRNPPNLFLLFVNRDLKSSGLYRKTVPALVIQRLREVNIRSLLVPHKCTRQVPAGAGRKLDDNGLRGNTLINLLSNQNHRARIPIPPPLSQQLN